MYESSLFLVLRFGIRVKGMQEALGKKVFEVTFTFYILQA